MRCRELLLMVSDPATQQLLDILDGLWTQLPAEVKAYGDARWPRGSHVALGWPYSQIMVIPSLRLMYVPIAKNACSTLKRMMLDLAGFPADSAAQAHVHECLDFYQTGLQLKDWPREDVERFLTEPRWFRFVVMRDPLERLVSAYLEKFVRNRLLPGNRVHTAPVVAAMQCTDAPDLARGITFRQFAEYVAATPAGLLDPHWRPQCLCVPEQDVQIVGFQIDQIDQLKSDLRAWCGCMPVVGHHNRTTIEKRAPQRGGLADHLPKHLDPIESICAQALLDSGIEHVLCGHA
ncbi:sulfotransferase family 2 domain-containing protein [Spiribacter insolitus]|uniref:Sulfotransferase family 2 domain-containing protein n=1 Tax=Spiribacter insolitus TaxID=3122417 RepID=A0ABV3T910_9GAMM